MYEAVARIFSRILQPHTNERFTPGNGARPTKHQHPLFRAPQSVGKRKTGENEDLPRKPKNHKRIDRGLQHKQEMI